MEDVYEVYVENDQYEVRISRHGETCIRNKCSNEIKRLKGLFGSRYHEIAVEYEVLTRAYITPDSAYCIITYGIGVIYFVDLRTGELIKEMKLFPEIDYDDETFDDDAFDEIDLGAYYMIETMAHFSPSGRYAVLRVRGDYDPESEDPCYSHTPVYLRSVFVVDLQTLQTVIEDHFDDVEERCGRNTACIAFSPTEERFAAGALLNEIKIFDTRNGKVTDRIYGLCGNSDPSNNKDLSFIVFIDRTSFLFTNSEKNLVHIDLNEDGKIAAKRVIDTHIRQFDHEITKNVMDRWADIERVEYQSGSVNVHYKLHNYGPGNDTRERVFTCSD